MGKYFVMSYRYDKQSYNDFGLVMADDGRSYVLPEDGSTWIQCYLYDFGWGPEIGYYRSPLPEYNKLFQAVLENQSFDDVYGAAAVIMRNYPEKLLVSCEKMIFSETNRERLYRIADIFQLSRGINRSPIEGKTYDDICRDACRWETLAKQLRKMD